MKSAITLFILITLFSCSMAVTNKGSINGLRAPASGDGKLSCLILLSRLIGKTDKLPTYLQDEVDLIWYPKAGYVYKSHYQIRIEDTMYDAQMGIKEKSKFEAAYRSAKSGKGFFRFKLAVTPEELENLRNFVKDPENASRFQTCVGGVCHIVRNNTKIKIPFPFSQVPTLNAIYLTIMKKLGYQRILKVEYVGKSAWRNLISTEVPYELSLSLAVGDITFGIIVWVIDEAGEVIPLIVPISEDKEENTTDYE